MRLFWKKAPPQKVLPINDETSYEVLLTVDFGSLITYPDKNKDDFIENIRFAKIQAALGLQFDTISWANNCYDIIAGKRELQEISLHYSDDGTNYLLIDSYFDPIDQLDLIQVGFKTPAFNENTLKHLCRDFPPRLVFHNSTEKTKPQRRARVFSPGASATCILQTNLRNHICLLYRTSTFTTC